MKQLAVASLFLVSSSLFAAQPKTYDATYTATVAAIPAGAHNVTLWIPLPVTRGAQKISNVQIDSPYDWTRRTEDAFGNSYATTTVAEPPAGEVSVKVHFTATRIEESIDHPLETKATKAELQRALRADKLVTLSPRVRTLANQLTAGKKGTVEQARAIYDYLVTNMTYDKVVPGWGRGDTERACDIKKGNCTDFHSLFISLARAKGIPARFVIGFPLTAKDGVVKGYHCWAEFYVRGKGWIPVDASDASKDATKREYLFGHLDTERVQFTIGRDIELSPRTAEPLNFFIYPHAESNGLEVGSPMIALQFTPKAGEAASSR